MPLTAPELHVPYLVGCAAPPCRPALPLSRSMHRLAPPAALAEPTCRRPLASTPTHPPALLGPQPINVCSNHCLTTILIDNADNRYHGLAWDVPLAEGLLGAMDCAPTGALPTNGLQRILEARPASQA